MFEHKFNSRASFKRNTRQTENTKDDEVQVALNPISESNQLNNNTQEHNEENDKVIIGVTIDFPFYFTWLERGIWLTMLVGVAWALIYDFKKATSEECTMNNNIHYPANLLPSLSRSMSSFRIGLAIWTMAMAIVFGARLLSSLFLHRMFREWYEDTLWNKIFLKTAYILDILEICSLILIPAFSLDCDPKFHSVFFLTFVALTYTAEILQYCSRFLKRKPQIMLDPEVDAYYKHIGVLIILQTLFIVFMVAGNILHSKLCHDYLYTAFALGEYITVVINVRFKRDTIRFVR